MIKKLWIINCQPLWIISTYLENSKGHNKISQGLKDYSGSKLGGLLELKC